MKMPTTTIQKIQKASQTTQIIRQKSKADPSPPHTSLRVYMKSHNDFLKK